MKLEEIKGSGDLDGCLPGSPPYNPATGFDAGDSDAMICSTSTCTACGHHGMEFHPYIREEPSGRSRVTGGPRYSYRAFAVCPACQDAAEF
jgi:hypothetical protein